MAKLIGIQYYSGDKKTKGHLDRYYCSLPDGSVCPLLERGQCVERTLFGHCVYGEVRREEGYTTNAYRNGGKWRTKAREVVKAGPPDLDYPNPQMVTYIGDYVWLPYPHMNHSDGERLGTKFSSYSGWLSRGSEFMKREDFTPEMVVLLCKLRPHALMGGEITDYQQKHLPCFLYDLSKLDNDLLEAAMKLDPIVESKLPKPENLKWAKASVAKIAPGTRVSFLADDPVGIWDGETITYKNDLSISLRFKRDMILEAITTVKPKPDVFLTVHDEQELLRLFETGDLVLNR